MLRQLLKISILFLRRWFFIWQGRYIYCFLLIFALGLVHAHMMSSGLLGINIEPKQLKLVASLHYQDLALFDDDKNGMLQPDEVTKHHARILIFLRQKITIGFSAPQKTLLRDDFFLSNESLIYQKIYTYRKAPDLIHLDMDFGQWKIIVKKGDDKRHTEWAESHQPSAPLTFNFRNAP